MTEIMVILVIAVIFLGPEKLPDAASKISKGIRDIRKQTRELTQTIENDTEIGGAIRELKSALRGEDLRRPPVRKDPSPPALAEGAAPAATAAGVALPADVAAADSTARAADASSVSLAGGEDAVSGDAAPASRDEHSVAGVLGGSSPGASPSPPARTLTLPTTVGERADGSGEDDDATELAKLVRPASGTAQREGRRE